MQMASALFSSSVLRGLQIHGITLDKVAQITSMPVAELRQVLKQKACFNEKQLNAIELETGVGLGELTLLANPDAAADSDFSALMRGWDDVAQLCEKKPAAAK